MELLLGALAQPSKTYACTSVDRHAQQTSQGIKSVVHGSAWWLHAFANNGLPAVQALFDLEATNQDLKPYLRDLYITSAQEIETSSARKAIVIHVRFCSLLKAALYGEVQ